MEKSIIKQKIKIGLSVGVLIIVSQLVFLLLSLLVKKLNLVTDSNQYIIMYILNALSIYGAGYSVFKLLLRKVETIEKPEKKKIKFGELIVLIVVTIGATNFVNIITQMLIMLVRAATGHEIDNSVSELIQNSNPIVNIAFAVIIGPIFEELIIRGTLMKRLRVYGDKTALIYTALAFGLFHGNINQIPYAFACGLVFGYAMIKSNNIKYSIILHMALNSIAIILSILLKYELTIPMLVSVLLIMASMLFAVIYLPIKLTSGKVSISNDSKYEKKKLYLNVGYIFTLVTVVAVTVIDAIF